MCKRVCSEERMDRCWDRQEGNQGDPCSDACEHSSKQTHFWLQCGRFRHLQMVSPGLGGCSAGVFFCLCELWTLADFLRHLLFRDRFLKSLSPSVLPCMYFVCVCEKIKKVFMKFPEVPLSYISNNVIARLTAYSSYGTHRELEFWWERCNKMRVACNWRWSKTGKLLKNSWSRPYWEKTPIKSICDAITKLCQENEITTEKSEV